MQISAPSRLPFLKSTLSLMRAQQTPLAKMPQLRPSRLYWNGRSWPEEAKHLPDVLRLKFSPTEVGAMESRITQWYRKALVVHRHSSSALDPRPDFPRMEVLLYCPKMQLRNLIYRPVLTSAALITQHDACARHAVMIARETIQALTYLQSRNPLFGRKHLISFKPCLLAASLNLSMAVSNAPSVFWETAKAELIMALGLMDGLRMNGPSDVRMFQHLRPLGSALTRFRHQAQMGPGSVRRTTLMKLAFMEDFFLFHPHV